MRTQRLTQRHVQFGRSPQDAAQWMLQTDEPNARLIEGTKGRATAVFSWGAHAKDEPETNQR